MERIVPEYLRGVVGAGYTSAPSIHRKVDAVSTPNILRLERITDNGETTIGKLYFNGKFLCHTCEDTRRFYELSPHDPMYEAKVKGKTCIASGSYELWNKTYGGFFDDYVIRFDSINHGGMIGVRDVPNFTDILFHVGNTKHDTSGCILVGRKSNDDFVKFSAKTYKRVYSIVHDALLHDGGVTLIITDVEGRVNGIV